MGFMMALPGIIAALLSAWSGAKVLSGIALGVTLVGLWSYGIMHNAAVEAAKSRVSHSGRFFDITPGEAESAPNWVTTINLASTAGGLLLLALAIFWR